MIEAAIFDMDGVIIDSEPFWKEADMNVYPTLGIELNEKMCSQTTGLGIKDAVKYWYNYKPWIGRSFEEIEQDIVNYVLKCIMERGEPMPDLDYILDFFETRNIKLAIASASSMYYLKTVLEKLEIMDRFALYHSSELELNSKPHPAVYLTTARMLGVKPENCIVIEDSINGMKAGKSAGMKVVVIPDKHLKKNMQFKQADVILNNFQEFDENIWQKIQL
jgi:sugar-phosphatase